jgi:hypothetical protein
MGAHAFRVAARPSLDLPLRYAANTRSVVLHADDDKAISSGPKSDSPQSRQLAPVPTSVELTMSLRHGLKRAMQDDDQNDPDWMLITLSSVMGIAIVGYIVYALFIYQHFASILSRLIK